jgi:hypothetical protein
MTSAIDPRYELPHDWPTTEAEATAVQERLRGSVRVEGGAVPAPGGGAGAVVGVDVAYDDERGVVAAAAVALDARTLDVVGETTAVGRVTWRDTAPLAVKAERSSAAGAADPFGSDHVDHPDLVAAAEPWVGSAEILPRERFDVVDRPLGGHTHHTTADLNVGGRFRGVGDCDGHSRVARDVPGLLM